MVHLVGTSEQSDPFAHPPHRGGGLSRHAPRYWPPLAWSVLALVFGLSLTAWSTLRQQRQQAEDRATQTRELARVTFDAVQGRLADCERLLRAVQTAYLGAGELDAGAFQATYDNLRPREYFSALQALAFARLENGRYLTRQVAPRPGNERILGLDLAGQPANLATALRARDRDAVMLSPPFRLMQAGGAQGPVDGFTLRLPVYTRGAPPVGVAQRRARELGSLAVSFRANRLINEALPANLDHALRARVWDVSGTNAELLFDSTPRTRAGGTPLRQYLRFGGRTWRLDVHPGPVAALPWSQSVLLPGLVASVLLALLVGSLAGTRQRAIELGMRMSRRYRESESRFRALNDLLPALVVVAEREGGRILYANQAARLRLGQALDGVTLPALFEDADLRARFEAGGPAECANAEAQLRSTAGDRFWASVSIAEVELEDAPRLLMVASDISEQRQLTELLSYQASHDALTELYNRREFERRVEHAMARMAAGNPHCALLFLDLDQFKLVNDTSGHVAGDQLLSQIAALMREELRGGDVLARLGGDEFGVLATSVGRLDEARRVAERMRKRIDSHVFVWEDRSYAVTASIGGVMVTDPSVGLKELFAQADNACYMAKEGGRNRVHFFTESDDAFSRRRTEMDWANRLRFAVDEGRLMLMYQEVRPLAVDLEGGARVEMLLRFRETDGQVISPGAFIPAAERYGLMPLIDRWVIETTLANFDRLHPSGADLRLATINLSGASVEDDALADRVLELLTEHAIDPARVCFEITETVAVRNLAQVSQFIGRLRAAGCRIALDDFGAGMSSFGYLKSLPVDIIKIDGSFVQDLMTDAMSRSIVRAVTEIGHGFGLKVVAEWVSGHEVADALAEMGVDFAQGFGLHRPQPAVFHHGARPLH